MKITWLHGASMGSCAHPAVGWTVLLFSRQFDYITAALRDLSELSKWAEQPKLSHTRNYWLSFRGKRLCSYFESQEESAQLLEERIQKNPVSSGNFCLALGLPVRTVSISALLLDFWLKPTYVLFSQQCKSSCFPKAWEDPSDTSCSGQSRQGTLLALGHRNPSTQTDPICCIPASQSFYFFSCFHHLYVKQWLRPKRKIKYRERKQKTKKPSVKKPFSMPEVLVNESDYWKAV